MTKYYFKPEILYPVKYLAGQSKIKHLQTGEFSENLTPTVPVIGSYVRVQKAISGKMGCWEIVALILKAVERKTQYCQEGNCLAQSRKMETFRSEASGKMEDFS